MDFLDSFLEKTIFSLKCSRFCGGKTSKEQFNSWVSFFDLFRPENTLLFYRQTFGIAINPAILKKFRHRSLRIAVNDPNAQVQIGAESGNVCRWWRPTTRCMHYFDLLPHGEPETAATAGNGYLHDLVGPHGFEP